MGRGSIRTTGALTLALLALGVGCSSQRNATSPATGRGRAGSPRISESALRSAPRELILARGSDEGCVVGPEPSRVLLFEIDGAEPKRLPWVVQSTPVLTETDARAAFVSRGGLDVAIARWDSQAEPRALDVETRLRGASAAPEPYGLTVAGWTCGAGNLLIARWSDGATAVEISDDGRVVASVDFSAALDSAVPRSAPEPEEPSWSGYCATTDGFWFWDTESSTLVLLGRGGERLRTLEVEGEGRPMFDPHSIVVSGGADALFASMALLPSAGECPDQGAIVRIDTRTGEATRISPCGFHALYPAYSESIGLVFAGERVVDGRPSCAVYRMAHPDSHGAAELVLDHATEPRVPSCEPSLAR